jgi:hypothetical protein
VFGYGRTLACTTGGTFRVAFFPTAPRAELRVEQLGNHIGGIVIRHAWWQKGGNFAQVISGSDQTDFNVVAGAYLRISDVRYQRVAEAYSSHRVLDFSALGKVYA